MNRNYFFLVLPAVLALLMFSGTIRKSSSGAPASHTGAPGEKTCATSGCHDDTRPNIGHAKVDLELGENVTALKPGETYPIKIKIEDVKVNRFGFQLLALFNKTNANAGRFIIADSARTQMVTNQYELRERNYVTYTFDGTDAVYDGKGEWTVNWQAPEDTGKGITFYLATVSGNDDMSDKGDKVYTRAYSFKSNRK